MISVPEPTTFKPKVSIVIPVFNGEKYLREAIDSALSQTYKNIEIVVINDGSKDKTEDVALSYGDKIRYFKKENGGQSSALNFGIKQMTGEYFSWLSHDDVYFPDKIEKQIDILNTIENKNVLVYSDFINIDINSEPLRPDNFNIHHGNHIVYDMLVNSPVGGCTVLVPKPLIIQGFDERFPLTSDVRLWFDLALKFEFIYIPEKLVKNRIHGFQSSNLKKKELLAESNRFLISCLEKISSDELLQMSGAENLSEMYSNLALNFSKRGYLEAALKSLKLSGKSVRANKRFCSAGRLIVYFFYFHKKIRSVLKTFLYLFRIRN